MTLKAVLFDLGGTLLHYHDPQTDDPAHPFRRVTMLGIQAVLDQLGADGVTPPPVDRLQPVVDRHIRQVVMAARETLSGGSVETPIRAALAESGVALDDGRWLALRQHFYGPIDQIVFPREGVQATLVALRDAGYRLGLISNTLWAADLHDRHLAEHGLLDLLPVRVYSCDVPYQKPHPSIFHTALARLGVQPTEAVYVGDRVDADVCGAQGAGLRAILIRSPYSSGSLDGCTPDAIIAELPDLIPALAEIEHP